MPAESDPKKRRYTHYNPVEITISPRESIGTIALAILSILLLIALLRTQKQIREYMER